jgi:hypothetical protein
MSTTSDPSDPRLTRGADDAPVQQAQTYLVLSAAERAKGYVRPLRLAYSHEPCGVVTRMREDIAATYAAQPDFYGNTYCMGCRMHLPVSEFFWLENGTVTTLRVGS